MRIDVSSDTFERVHDFTRVLLQQGRPLLDRDWNEQTSIVLNQLRALGRAIYGAHGGPAGEACGFMPYEKDGALWFRKGQYVIDGMFFECHGDFPYPKQEDRRPEEEKDEDSKSETYLEKGKIQLVYLEAIEREVIAAEDPALLDSALPGVDLAARAQAVWRPRRCDWSSVVDKSSETFCKDAVVQTNEWFMRKRNEQESPGVLNAAQCSTLVTALKDKANQLLRLECHKTNPDAKTSLWKFSTDNGFPFFKIVPVTDDNNGVTVSLGNLPGWKPERSNIVELLTPEQVRFNESGMLVEVADVQSTDEQNLESANRVKLSLNGPVPSGATFLRVWRQQFTLPSIPGLLAGDYWQYAAREDVDPDPAAMRLKRMPRHCVPLALVEVSKDGSKVSILARFQRVVAPPWREIDEVIDGMVDPLDCEEPKAGPPPTDKRAQLGEKN